MQTFSFGDLSKPDAIKLLELIDLASSLVKNGDFQVLLTRLGELIPFDRAIQSRADLADLNDYLSITRKWPKEWRKHYEDSAYALIDPVVQVGVSRNFLGKALSWNEAFSIKTPMISFIKEAMDFKLVDGLAIAWKEPNTSIVGLLSLSGKTDSGARSKFILATVMPHLHHALSFIGDPENQILTTREREVINLIADGHNRLVTSRLLLPAASLSTVNQYCTQIIKKLEARNIVHAIMIAFTRRLL